MFDLGSLLTGFIVVEWVLRFVMLFVVLQTSRPARANAWLLLIMFSPTFGSIAYYMFGNPKLPKRRRVDLQHVEKLTASEIAKLRKRNTKVFQRPINDDYQSIATLAEKLGGLPPMGGNSIKFMDCTKV